MSAEEYVGSPAVLTVDWFIAGVERTQYAIRNTQYEKVKA